MYPENRAHGALLAIAAAFMFAAMGAVIKAASAHLPNEMVVFFRNFFGLLALLPWLLRGGVRALATQRFGSHLTRSLAGLAAMYCFFYAIAKLHLAEAVLLNFTAPLFIPFIALLWLHERVERNVWWAIIVGFLGIALILKPGMDIFSPAALIGLASGALAAFAMVNIRRMSETEPTTRIVFYFSTVSVIVSALPLLWRWQTPGPEALGLMVVAGIFATSGQLLLTRGYALAPAALVGPFTYSSVVFAALFGWLLWEEMPDALSLAGAVLVCLAGIMAMRKTEMAVAGRATPKSR
ncbi:MAG: DMT family transporter [Gammaproteobacteria bacterium]|nr:DMT family transporter [Gammaproteobacteria bacterium]